MFGNNPKRKATMGDGSTLALQSIFTTIQGEGPYAGIPAIFVRLGGCNLACSFCDTEFESFEESSLETILGEVKQQADDAIKLVVITGGEPFRQPIEALCSALLGAGFKVQIETNGTIWREIDERVDIVCSPKNVSGKYVAIRQDVLARTSALKFLISAVDKKYQDVAEVGQADYNIDVYVQPMDAHNAKDNAANKRRAVELALLHGYRLSLQLHKVLEIE